MSIKVLLESLLRNEDGITTTAAHIRMLVDRRIGMGGEIPFLPSRVLLQDFAGIPSLMDLAVIREAVAGLGVSVDPMTQVDLVIDHSLIAEFSGDANALERNVAAEYASNAERYRFLRWAQRSFRNLTIVPPGAGIVHQINIEHLAQVVTTREVGTRRQAFPDTCVGTDSHTTMVNALGVLGWGVGGIEADAAILGQSLPMLIPRILGVELSGRIGEAVTATDVVLTLAQALREHGVVGKIVEFYGPGIAGLSLADRATIANMSPEFGSTAAMFPIDQVTLDYLRMTGRTEHQIALVEAYARLQTLWHEPHWRGEYDEEVIFDLGTVRPSIAGPRRPHDRIDLAETKRSFSEHLRLRVSTGRQFHPVPVILATGEHVTLDHGAVTIAAITSCTNTSNPQVMVAAGLLARNARKRGLRTKAWVKTTLAPGSRVVTDYLRRAGLTPALEELGFYTVGYGCTTCVGNSGPLAAEVSDAIRANDLMTVAVLSGNRNFEGRIHSEVRMNYLASPPLVVAYAIAGSMDVDFEREPLGTDTEGRDVFLRDIWPSSREAEEVVASSIGPDIFAAEYAAIRDGDHRWQALEIPPGPSFQWDPASLYLRRPPFLDLPDQDLSERGDVLGARVLVKLGDSVTTDHISPVGTIQADSPAGVYLTERGVARRDYSTYGLRRGNHDVMVRGTFANTRLRNRLLDDVEGGYTRDFSRPDGPVDTVFGAAEAYRTAEIPVIVLAGKEYGTGSSRDWAAKGTRLLGVRAVIAESYERIHRSNLVGMGVLPLQFLKGEGHEALGLDGTESFTIHGVGAFYNGKHPQTLHVVATPTTHSPVTARPTEFDVLVRIDTTIEAEYFRTGGVLPFVRRTLGRTVSSTSLS